MPTYAYACKDCGHAFDIQQSFTDSTLTVCPECEGALRKKFNSVGVVFKGSGFYRTDSRDSKGSTVSAGKDSASSGKETSAGKEPSATSTPAPATAGASASSAASGAGSTSSKAAAAS